MASNPIVSSLTFTGSVAGQASIQAQGIAGGLTLLLPNMLPIQGQLLDVQSLSGNNVFLGWVSAQSEQINLTQLAQSSATTGQVIEWNGSAWAPATVPGIGSQSANLVLASPNGAPGTPVFRQIFIADINSVQGNGGQVQLSSQNGAMTSLGQIAQYDGGGNVNSSGVLLSTLAPKASPIFTGGVTLARLKASSPDTAGILAMAGTTVTYTFASAYTGTNAPVVVITPRFDPGGNNADFWITYTGTSGAWTAFIVHNSISQTGNLNYIVIDIG